MHVCCICYMYSRFEKLCRACVLCMLWYASTLNKTLFIIYYLFITAVSTWGAVRSLRKCYMRSKLLYAFLQRKQWWSIKRINNSDKKTTIDNSVSRRNTNRRILTPISVSLFSFLCRNVNPWLALDLSSLTQLFHTFMLIIFYVSLDLHI
jgi:hypothetical protein